MAEDKRGNVGNSSVRLCNLLYQPEGTEREAGSHRIYRDGRLALPLTIVDILGKRFQSIDRQHFAPSIYFLFFLFFLLYLHRRLTNMESMVLAGWTSLVLPVRHCSSPPPPSHPTTAVARHEHLQRSPLAHPSSLSGLTFLGYDAGLPGSSGIHSVFYSLDSKIH